MIVTELNSLDFAIDNNMSISGRTGVEWFGISRHDRRGVSCRL